jgi:uncharacterized protein
VQADGRRSVSRGNEQADDRQPKIRNRELRTSIVIGVISDTHGLLRPEAIDALRGSKHIIHAGDIGASEILDELATIAPVTAIRGNIDKSAWARRLPETELVELAGISIYVLHDLAQIDLKPEAAGFRVVIYGHSHVPKQETRGGVLYFNPGSAGPRRFKLPVTVGRLIVTAGDACGEIVPIL